MTIDEMIEVLQAYKEGKVVERQTPTGWIAITNLDYINFNFGTSIYRIKPQPEYVPFTWEDRDLFRGEWVKWKRFTEIDTEFIVDCICKKGLIFSLRHYDYEYLFNRLEFIDGTPFGKLKQ